MSGGRQTWALDQYHGGIDLRDGLFSSNQTRFRELTNFRIDKGKKLERRPPCQVTGGVLDADTQGLIQVDGQLYTFAPKGASVTHTGEAGTLVETLFFDVPNYATGSWELLAAGVFDGYAVAWIRHAYGSTAYPSLTFLHVWDGLLYAPTYVQDPYLPGSFSPSIADLVDQRYSATFSPVLGQGATKLWTSTLRGNAHCSRTADARVWNQRTHDSILQDGEHWCFVVPEGISLKEFIVPRNVAWLSGDGRWAYYALEYKSGDAWVPMEQKVGNPFGPFTWRYVVSPSRFAGGWDEIKLQISWGSDAAGLIRFRMVAGETAMQIVGDAPTVTLETVGADKVVVVGACDYTYRGGDTQRFLGSREVLPVGSTCLAGVFIPREDTGEDGSVMLAESVADKLKLWDESVLGFPKGWDREHMLILKRIQAVPTASAMTARNPSWTGTTQINVGLRVTLNSQTVECMVNFGWTWVGANPAGVPACPFAPYVGTTITINGQSVTLVSYQLVYGIGSLSSNHYYWTLTVSPAMTAIPSPAWTTVYATVPTTFAARYSGGQTQIKLAAAMPGMIVGSIIEANGQRYKVSAISTLTITITNEEGTHGDYTAGLKEPMEIFLTGDPVVTDYQYAHETQAAGGSEWYADRVIEAVDNAGAEDAMAISTAAQDNTGGLITAIGAIRQRMLITYAGSMQLWAIDQDTNRTALLDSLNFGTGSQPTPQLVPWFGSMMTTVENGIRSMSVTGANTDVLQDLNVGEPIEPLPPLVATAAHFWPHLGLYMVAGDTDEGTVFRCLDYSRESKISAWSQWTVTGLNGVDTQTLIPMGSSLWFRSGTALWHFNAASTVFRDSGNTPGDAYTSRAVMHFNDMGKPGTNKRFTGLDIVQDGTGSVSFLFPPYGGYGEAGGTPVQGPTITGITYGHARIPMALTGSAIAPVIETQDEAGYRLQRIAVDFLTLRR